jgi:hypothetical protein
MTQPRASRPANPSRHSKPRGGTPKSRRVGPSDTQAQELPRRRGIRNAKPKRVHTTTGAARSAKAPKRG